MARMSAEYHRAYYRANREHVLASRQKYASKPENRRRKNAVARQRYQERMDLIQRLKNVPCADCGGTFPSVCMDFDHVLGTKLREVARSWSFSTQFLFDEIAKCEVVCANCHRLRTAKRRKHGKASRNLVR